MAVVVRAGTGQRNNMEFVGAPLWLKANDVLSTNLIW